MERHTVPRSGMSIDLFGWSKGFHQLKAVHLIQESYARGRRLTIRQIIPLLVPVPTVPRAISGQGRSVRCPLARKFAHTAFMAGGRRILSWAVLSWKIASRRTSSNRYDPRRLQIRLFPADRIRHGILSTGYSLHRSTCGSGGKLFLLSFSFSIGDMGEQSNSDRERGQNPVREVISFIAAPVRCCAPPYRDKRRCARPFR